MHREEDCANELPCDNKKNVKAFEYGKKNKATGPDNINQRGSI